MNRLEVFLKSQKLAEWRSHPVGITTAAGRAQNATVLAVNSKKGSDAIPTISDKHSQIEIAKAVALTFWPHTTVLLPSSSSRIVAV